MNVNNYFTGAMIGATINVIWNAFPITYMLLEHQKSFSVQLNSRKGVLVSRDTDVTVQEVSFISHDTLIEDQFRSKKVGFSFVSESTAPFDAAMLADELTTVDKSEIQSGVETSEPLRASNPD